ncbi:hypothetical protein RHMOL_Rhmol07G0116300 [Rhododendron molle]|uniref:Uncharacterized protein n=1 Tax=Rhododendron molle TaxID=49168 RepID=A0ACC0MZK4_RHOML|nr:hypothetical protein RHMOL_Rhmol07G0116300 [Rhododendron molle]
MRCRSFSAGGDINQSLSFCFSKPGIGKNHSGWVSFVTDGAWLADSNIGAAAWVLDSSEENPPHQCVQCRALSASFVEIRAGLMVLHWALEHKIDNICIKTNCAVFVQGLSTG